MELSPQQISQETKNFFKKVYLWMFVGLFISGTTAFTVANSREMILFILGNRLVFFGLLIAEFVLIVGLVGLIKKMSAISAIFMFVLYSFVNGLTLSVIFLAYDIKSIFIMFFAAAAMFVLMSLYGYLTNADLTAAGHILIAGLVGIIIAALINIFMNNTILDLIISAIGVLVFTGLIAYDTQKIKKVNIIGNEGTTEDMKESIIGALDLYLDFVNLFLNLLRLGGKRR